MNRENRIQIRNAELSDHRDIISVMPEWWGGRDLTASVPRLFLRHFGNTSFVAERDGQLCGFLIGFFSQVRSDEGYIHFAGVHPEMRKTGLARRLYERFYDVCHGNFRPIVRSCTAPINKLSIGFHRAMGFSMEPGDAHVDGVPVTTGYLKDGEQLVLFKKDLG